jgi:type IV pilus assembly protein PilM
LSSESSIRRGVYKSGWVRRLVRWMDDIARPGLAFEISPEQIAGVRISRTGGLDAFATQGLPPGTLRPSAVDANITNPAAAQTALREVAGKLGARNEQAVLLLPDPVIRVFVQHFDEFPRGAAEAIPMLRWKLKKSVPFEAEETLISYMRQAPREQGVDIVTSLARLRIVREYEALAEGAGLTAGVVLSSSLAAIALLDDSHPVMLARVSGNSLTTAIVKENILCGYRCTELAVDTGALTPAMLLEELFPMAAYYQDSWREGLQGVNISGLGRRLADFVGPLETELHCPVRSLGASAFSQGRVGAEAKPLAERELDGLVGWMLQG